MNREVILDIVLNTTPAPISDALRRKQYADRFRHQAAKWRATLTEYNQMSHLDHVEEGQQLDLSGKLLIAAHDAGVLPDVGAAQGVGGLHQLVNEYTKPEEPEQEPLGYGRARLTRCPVNLFLDFAGGNRIPVRNDGDGLKITGPRFGGVAPRLDPGILSLPRNQHYAAVCDLLADLIEQEEPAVVEACLAPSPVEPSRAVDVATDRFPPHQYVDEHGTCDFHERIVPWQVFRAIYQARAKLTLDRLSARVPAWKDACPTHETVKQAMTELRSILRKQGREQLAKRLKTAGGYYFLEDAAAPSD